MEKRKKRGFGRLCFLQKLREPDAQFGGLSLDLGEAEGELPLLRGRLGGAALAAIAVADVLQAAGRLLADALPVGLELLAAHVLPHALDLGVREDVRDDLRRALLEVFCHRRPSSCLCPAYCNPGDETGDGLTARDPEHVPHDDASPGPGTFHLR